jgi:hypothetical protein
MDGEEESVGGQKIESIEGSHRSIPSGHISPRDKGHFGSSTDQKNAK